MLMNLFLKATIQPALSVQMNWYAGRIVALKKSTV